MGVSDRSDDCVRCLAGKLACGKSHRSELSVTLSTMEGQKMKSVSISLQDLSSTRSIKTDLSETNKAEENKSFTSKVWSSPLMRCP